MNTVIGRSAVPLSTSDSVALDHLCTVLRDAVTTRSMAPPGATVLADWLSVLVRLCSDEMDPVEPDPAAADAGPQGWRAVRLPLPPPLRNGVAVEGPGGEFNVQLDASGRLAMGAWSAPRDSAPALALFDVRETAAGTVLHVGSGEGDAVELTIAGMPTGTAAPAATPANMAPANVAPPAVPAPAWLATHAVGTYPLEAREVADPRAPVVVLLAPGTQLRVVETLGAWAHVDAANGWAAWVDGRMLVSFGGAAAAPAAP